nr:hypothetical protein [Tanacetum cinerariifolium]
IIESQRSENVKEGIGYNVVPPPAANLYHSPKKDLSWTGLPEFADDTVTDYSDKPAERPTTDKVETAKKPAVRYAEMYRRTSKRETTRSQNHAYKSPSHRTYVAPMRPSHGPASHRPHGPLMRPMRSNMNDARLRTSAVRPQYRAPWVPTVNRNFPLVNRKLPTGNSNVSTVCCCCSRHVNTARPKAVINRRNRVKDVQASASWVWKSFKPNSVSIILKRYDYVDVRGRSSFPTSSDVFPLPEEVPTARAILPLLVKKCSHYRVDELPLLKSLHCWSTLALQRLLSVLIILEDPVSEFSTSGIKSQELVRSRIYKEITCSCFHCFIDRDLINLVIPDVRRYVVVLT